MDSRDEELDDMLAPLRGETPTALELKRWQAAIDAAGAHERKRRSAYKTWQLVAACVVSGMIGSWIFAKMQPSLPCRDADEQLMAHHEISSDATFERIHVKLD